MSACAWFLRPPAPKALRLFCFPYAGGSAGLFHQWNQALTDVDVCAVQLPGRANRLAEPAFTDFESLIEALLPLILAHADRPFALFGHSMGALIAFRLAQRLQTLPSARPQQLFVSACAAPQIPRTRQWHLQDDAALLETLRAYAATPAQVLQNPELMELLLPMLRADFQLLASYRYQRGEKPLSCPIHVLSGHDDHSIPSGLYADWGKESRHPATFTVFRGGHFFLDGQMEQVGRQVREFMLQEQARKSAAALCSPQ